MKKIAILLGAGMVLAGCKRDPYLEWHRLQAEIQEINNRESINCKKQGKEWGMDRNGFGPICVTVQTPPASTPAPEAKK